MGLSFVMNEFLNLHAVNEYTESLESKESMDIETKFYFEMMVESENILCLCLC